MADDGKAMKTSLSGSELTAPKGSVLTPPKGSVLTAPKGSVLIVEDEGEIRTLMALHLNRQGYQVHPCASAEQALDLCVSNKFDLIVLDWMLPGISGVEFLQRLPRSSESRVLMVTAKTEPDDIVKGLESGADDYLTKPFDLNIFLARIRALLRRGSISVENFELLEIGALKLNKKTCEVICDGEILHLTPSEYKLLVTMMESQGRVLTRGQLIENIQGEGVNVIGRTIDTHVFGLRKKLGAWSERVETIRGIGYRVRLDG